MYGVSICNFTEPIPFVLKTLLQLKHSNFNNNYNLPTPVIMMNRDLLPSNRFTGRAPTHFPVLVLRKGKEMEM